MAQSSITPLSITDSKISNRAKIDPKKLAPGKTGQVLIAGEDGKFVAGDLPSTTTIVASEEEVLPPNSVKIGPSSYYHGGNNTTKKVGTGPEAIPQRDSSGNLKAETADQATNATNADKLDNQDGTYYTNTDNQTSGTTTTTNGLNGLTFTTQTKPFKEVIATFPYQYNGTGYGGTNFVIDHNLGYIPTVKCYKPQSNDVFEEIELDVESTTIATTVRFNYINHDVRVVLR